ncbi:cupredoxin domain-containing protein [Candidatus Woesebacteria bacterium]|nr:cupredoxin domain-containing protein [Candidatus Woesebacteria bacterium]
MLVKYSKPQTIKVKKGGEVKLTLMRKDPNSCLEEFILPDFKIKKYLPLNKKVEIAFKSEKSGEFGFHCGMNMYHGKIVVS